MSPILLHESSSYMTYIVCLHIDSWIVTFYRALEAKVHKVLAVQIPLVTMKIPGRCSQLQNLLAEEEKDLEYLGPLKMSLTLVGVELLREAGEEALVV